MHYWNRDNFEGLLRIAEALKVDARLAGLAEYCTLRERGLRRDALAALDRFLDDAQRWEPREARRRALLILDIRLRSSGVHQFLTEPLRRRFLVPVLQRWCDEGDAPPPAVRGLGILTSNVSLVERALQQDASDAVARRHVLTHHLHFARYAMHHLDESRFIGSESEAADDLERARMLLASAPDSQDVSDLAEEYAGLRLMLDDWLQFRAATPEPFPECNAFPEWCRARGREHSWPTKVYYPSSRASDPRVEADGSGE